MLLLLLSHCCSTIYALQHISYSVSGAERMEYRRVPASPSRTGRRCRVRLPDGV
ncbi:hypothetical protein FOTG_18623 [Fusarium oxysporum f. sp. vasinfectum 25433]|uniref:Uncharacterized protein n=1 Tax=Fusarium oxysporum f. sp. vasinfectum 25433 TaxID=1089449 RepID=X0KW40_FUSOX|nr:hypothetical protein FOTG_18623 [Fusarium oxysporum f. sp. vasinfectum 25433]